MAGCVPLPPYPPLGSGTNDTQQPRDSIYYYRDVTGIHTPREGSAPRVVCGVVLLTCNRGTKTIEGSP